MNATLRIWGSPFAIFGCAADEIRELEATFAGDVVQGPNEPPQLTIRRLPAIAAALPEAPLRPRHRAGYGSRYYLLDGTVFDDRVQQRDVVPVAEGDDLFAYAFPGTLMVSSRREILLFADRLPQMLLSDIVENWLLWNAREEGIVMAHGAAWARNGEVEVLAADSGGGKTTELFRQVQQGAAFFSNDRVALRVRGDRVEARSFPQPVNVGFGTVRSLGLNLPVFDDSSMNKVRLSAAEVANRYRPDYQSWLPVRAVYASSPEGLDRNVHWEGDAHHPFWNRALPPRLLDHRDLRRRLAGLLSCRPVTAHAGDLAAGGRGLSA